MFVSERVMMPTLILVFVMFLSPVALATFVGEFTMTEAGVGYDRLTISATGMIVPLLLHTLPETKFVIHDVWHVTETVTDNYHQLNKHLFTDAIEGPAFNYNAYQLYRGVLLSFIKETPRTTQPTLFGAEKGFFETLYYYLEPYHDDQLLLLTRNHLTASYYRASDLTFIRVLHMPGHILASNGYRRTHDTNTLTYTVGLDQAVYGDVFYAYSKRMHEENRLQFVMVFGFLAIMFVIYTFKSFGSQSYSQPPSFD